MIYIIITLLMLAPVFYLAMRSMLAKKPGNLGVVNGRLALCPSAPNCVSTQAADTDHFIAPISFEGTPEQAIARLKKVIGAVSRMKVITESEVYLHAEATSLIFRFVDDVEFLLDREAKVIHLRSASRVGHSDLGANRARMERFREMFQQQP